MENSMRTQHLSRFLTHIFIIGIIALQFSACGSGGQDSDNTGNADIGSGNLSLAIQWSESAGASTRHNREGSSLDCVAANVTTVEAQVYGPTDTLIAAGGPWNCDIRQGTINNIDATAGCTVVVIAKNPEGQIVYRGIQEGVDIIANQNASAEINAELYQPRLISPASGAEDTAITCVWDAVPGSELYEFRMSEFDDMHQYTVIQTTGTSLKPAGLTAGTTYYCQIAARDKFGNTSCGSNISDFSVTMGSPELVYPGKDEVVLPGSVKLSWTGPEADLLYHITLSTEFDLDPPLIEMITTIPGETEFDFDNAINGVTYYWQVAALDPEGNFGAPAAIFSFTAGEANLHLNKPQNNTIFSKENIRFNWIPVQPSPVAYRVTIFDAIQPDHAIDTMVVTEPNYESNLLNNGTDYLWKVEAIDEDGTATHISQTWSVSTLDYPRLIAPGDNTDRHPDAITFEWQQVPNQGYLITVAADEAFDNVVSTALLDKNTTTVDADGFNLDSARTYYWRVCPLNSNDESNTDYGSDPYQINTLIIKILFAIDCSGSMGAAGQGSDPDNLRLDAVSQFINNYNRYQDISFEIILWNNDIFRSTMVFGQRGFTKDIDEINSVLNSVNNTGTTDYVKTIETIHNDISLDIDIVNNSGTTANTKYIAIFLSDGLDNVPGQTGPRVPEIIDAVEALVEAVEGKGVHGLEFNTYMLNSLFILDDDLQACQDLLSQMADSGQGHFRDFNTAESIEFLQHLIF